MLCVTRPQKTNIEPEKDQLEKEHLFVPTSLQEFQQVNQELGEIGGVFVSKQPSDTDMGAKEPKTVLLKGIFYGKVRICLCLDTQCMVYSSLHLP